jgi:rhodanese-related sulfurtransferase
MKNGTWFVFLGILILAACSPAPANAPAMQEAAPAVAADSQVTELAPAPTEAGYIELEPQAARDLIDSTPGLVIVDVSPGYDNGHLPGAISIPLNQLADRLNELDPANPHLVYCHSDSSAIRAAEMLVNNGFSPVYRLLGNYQGWVDAGFPVEK